MFNVETKELKIIDFGFSVQLSSNQELIKLQCGTHAYMDPDLIRKKSYSPQAADIWACGIVMYTLLTGVCPFESQFEKELTTMICDGKFKEIPSYPEANSLLAKMLQVDKSKRITAKQVRIHSISLFFTGAKRSLVTLKLILFIENRLLKKI